MTKPIRWIVHCVIITWLAVSVALFGAHAFATAFSNDQSDLWWNPSESGDLPVTITVTQTGPSVTMAFSLKPAIPLVTATGTLSQIGQFGSVIGTYSGAAENDVAQTAEVLALSAPRGKRAYRAGEENHLKTAKAPVSAIPVLVMQRVDREVE